MVREIWSHPNGGDLEGVCDFSSHLRGRSVGSNLNQRGCVMLSAVRESKIKGGVGWFDTLTFFKGLLVASLTSDVAK